MENDITKELEKLKKELSKKKEEIQDLKQWVKKEIDQDRISDIADFSERELESLMDEYHSLLDRTADPVPDKRSITSHRKGIGKPIVWMKRILLNWTKPFLNLILDKQKVFNRKSIELSQALILHQKRYHERISLIDERLGECEVDLKIMSKKIEELSGRCEGFRSDVSPIAREKKPDT